MRRTSIPISLALALALLTPSILSAQGFQRFDAYDFRGTHGLSITGPDRDHLQTLIGSDADFRLFHLRLPLGEWISSCQLQQIDIDWGDASPLAIFSGGPGAAPLVVNHTYPEPPNGIRAGYTVSATLHWVNSQELGCGFRTVSYPITVYAAPRVYKDSEGNTFVQPRNEECSSRIPVLVVEGIDPTNQTFQDSYYEITTAMADNLHDNGFELFFLNFKDGSRSMRLNADVVLSALDAVHALCPNNQIALAGMSMGGVICRYALAKAESQRRVHNVGLFLSYDAPQEGAYVNADFQSKLKDIGGLSGSQATLVARLRASLQCDASMELLGFNVYDAAYYPPIQDDTKSVNHKFYTDLKALNGDGYPHSPFNVAVSNGNYDHTQVPFADGRELAHLIVEGIPIITANANQYDGYPGSRYTNLAFRRFGDIFIPPFFDIWYEYAVDFNPSFVHTFSSLDLASYHVDQNWNYERPIAASRFDDTAVQSQTLMHSQLSDDSQAHIYSWLNRTSTLTVSYALAEGGSTGADTYSLTILRPNQVLLSSKTAMVNGSQLTYVFWHWDDGSTENPRTFYSSHDLARTVTMKAHLASTSSANTWLSSQRRLTEDFDATGPSYHGVYESAGSIWYLRNRLNAGWENERVLSFGATAASAPAVTTYSWGHPDEIQVKVAWAEPGGMIMYRESNIDNGATWKAPVSLPIGQAQTTPLLPDPYGLVLCYPGVGIGYYKLPETNNSWQSWPVPGTLGNVTGAAVCAGSSCRYELAFIKDGKVWVEGFNDPDLNNFWVGPQLCDSAINLTTSGWSATNPSIVSYGTSLFVAWEESNGASRHIAFKQRSAGTWSSTLYFTHLTHVPTKPVLGIDYPCGTVKLLWQCSDHIARVSRPIAGSLWAPVEDLGPGGAPNIVAWGQYNATAMWTSGTAAPYSINLANSCTTVSGGGGCPYLDTRTANGWTVENSVLARSTSGALGMDGYRLKETPAVADGRYRLRLRENEQEYTTLDQVRLGYVDHASDVRAYALGDRVVLGTQTPPYRVTTSRGEEITSLVNGSGTGWFAGQPGDTVLVELVKPGSATVPGTAGQGAGGLDPFRIDDGGKGGASGGGGVRATGAGEGSALPDAMVLSSTGILIQGQDAAGVWSTIRQRYPREKFDEFLVDTLDQGPVRMVFVGQHRLRFVGRVTPAGAVTPQGLSLLAARHSRLGDVRATLLNAGDATTSLIPGDTLGLEFSATPIPAGQVRDFFLLSRGVYTSGTTQLASRPEPASAPPTSLALHQNRPNPFTGGTVIGFELPRGERVRLEVFDLQGRMVRSLADAGYTAGRWSVEWDGRDGAGNRTPVGIYLYRLTAGSFRDQKKMVLLP